MSQHHTTDHTGGLTSLSLSNQPNSLNARMGNTARPVETSLPPPTLNRDRVVDVEKEADLELEEVDLELEAGTDSEGGASVFST